MNGRSLSVAALVGSLATLVIVATMAGAGDATPSHEAPVAKPTIQMTSHPIQMPTSRAICRFVREQS